MAPEPIWTRLGRLVSETQCGHTWPTSSFIGARLFFRERTYPWKSPADDFASAKKLINECAISLVMANFQTQNGRSWNRRGCRRFNERGLE